MNIVNFFFKLWHDYDSTRSVYISATNNSKNKKKKTNKNKHKGKRNGKINV